jgi:hypothetical protein
MNGLMVFKVLRAADDVLVATQVHNRRNGPASFGPFDFEWILEVRAQDEREVDATRVPAGMSMTWWPMNEGGVG